MAECSNSLVLVGTVGSNPTNRSKKNLTKRATSGVDFTNILCAAFTHADTKSAKNAIKPLVFFCAFGISVNKICSSIVGENGPLTIIHFLLTNEK